MQAPDFFRGRIDAMINLKDPLAVLAPRLPWAWLEAEQPCKGQKDKKPKPKLPPPSYGSVLARRKP